MKLLQVTNLYSPNHGGGAEAPYQLAKHLMQAGHRVTVLTSDYKMTDEYRIQGIDTQSFSTKLAVANLHVTPGMLIYDFKDFDVIHLHNARTFQNIVAAHFAKKHKIPYILQAHGGIEPIFQKQGLKRIYDFAFGYDILADAAKVIAGNELEIEEYHRMGVPYEKITVIPPLYDITEYDNLPEKGLFRSKYNLQDQKIILFLGRIHKIKGLDFLLDAFKRLYRSNTKLVVAGSDGGYLDELRGKIVLIGLEDSVILTGLLRGQEKLSALVDADLLVQTSTYERGAGSPFEAVLCGTPIIVTSGTGAGDMVDKYDAGYTVKYGDIPELVRLMERTLDNPSNGKMKARHAAELIRWQLSWKNGLAEYEKLYESVRR